MNDGSAVLQPTAQEPESSASTRAVDPEFTVTLIDTFVSSQPASQMGLSLAGATAVNLGLTDRNGTV